LPVLVITVHVFVFIVFASLDGGRVTTLLLAPARHVCNLSIGFVNCESTSSVMVITSGNSRLRMQSIQILPHDG
jgi:hypothetical protein